MDLKTILVRRNWRLLTVILCLVKTTNPFANTIISISPSLVFQNNATNQTLLLQTAPQNLSNQYVGRDSWQNSAMLELFAGKKIKVKEGISLISGIKAGYIDVIELSGIVNQFALPAFNNLSYHYQIRSIALYSHSKLLLTKNKQWQPYASLSLGGAVNTAYGYNETPLINGAVAMAPFANKSKISVSYGLGFGLHLYSNKAFSWGFGYEFADLGQTRLGLSNAQTTRNTPTQKHVYINKLIANLNWDL